MTGLILKLSYNNPNESTIVGGICGSFFPLQPNIAITAHHVLNNTNFMPNDGFLNCQYWLITDQNNIIEIEKDKLISYPEIDTTYITLERDYFKNYRKYSTKVETGTNCYNEGFIGGKMPDLDIKWVNNKLHINSCNYENVKINRSGYVKSIFQININATDVILSNINVIETSYSGIIGMSGGPLIEKEKDCVIGMMSIGFPPNVSDKTTLIAISIIEIIKNI